MPVTKALGSYKMLSRLLALILIAVLSSVAYINWGYKNNDIMVKAVANNHTYIIKLAVPLGLSPDTQNYNGASLLLAATLKNNMYLVSYLLKQGANPDIPNSTGVTPVYAASLLGHTEAARTLVDNKANVNTYIQAKNSTPLIIAAVNNNKEIVKLLLENGATLNTRNIENKTIAELLIDNENYEMLSFIKETNLTIHSSTPAESAGLDRLNSSRPLN